MKRIEAFIQPHRLNKVVTALHTLPVFPGFTVFDAHGQGHGRGKGGHFAYGDGGLLFHEHCVLVILCDDTHAEVIAQTIATAAHTGRNGDGIIAISEVNKVLRIRDTGGVA